MCMENQNLYDLLYDTLYMFPKTIIENIIFEYATESQKYIHKYTLPCDASYDNVQYNKHLGIICMKSDKSFKLIDYKTGMDHDSSIIDVKKFNSHFIKHGNYDCVFVANIFSFGYTILVNLLNYTSVHILRDKQYERIDRIRTGSSLNCATASNDILYCISSSNTQYVIHAYNVKNNKEYNSIIFSCKYGFDTIQISIHNGIIYICESDDINVYVYTHNDTTFDKLNQYSHTLCHDNLNQGKRIKLMNKSTLKLYKNKLYECVGNKINVYDVISFECICTFNINLEHDYHLSITDDILMVSNKEQLAIYDIKLKHSFIT